MYTSEELKKKIKEKAREQGMNVKQLAKEAGLSINYVYNINGEQGATCFGLAKIADVLECSINELLGRNCAK